MADAVVLCAGGHTRLWRRSSSRRDENYGEGMALALQAGCRLMDMELVQFHPTGMLAPEEAAATLVTEAVRGEGGQLTNVEGERFMARYDADRMVQRREDRQGQDPRLPVGTAGGPHGVVTVEHAGPDHDDLVRWRILAPQQERPHRPSSTARARPRATATASSAVSTAWAYTRSVMAGLA